MRTKPRILFRADASHDIGFGHVARVVALIEEAEAKGLDAIALFGGDPSAVTSWARDRGLANVDVRDWSTTQVIQVAEDPRVTAIVVDGPQLALDIIPKMPEHVRTILIDDAGKVPLKMTAVVNQNIHAPSLAATYPQARTRLLGRRYLMLRKDIRRYTRGSCRPMASARLRVLVTFGGSDPVNATSRLVSLIPDDRPLELVVVAGPGFRNDEALAEAAKIATERGHIVDVRRAPEDPGALFVSADAAICSAGGTLGELAYLGCPALAYAIAKDQVAPARLQIREGLISGGRTWAETDDDTLRSDIAAFLLDDQGRRAQRQRALATADSDGASRIIDEAVLGGPPRG
jgi:spore coat polysaccharide biosynthesis predicted glycosyltransferase SpsG